MLIALMKQVVTNTLCNKQGKISVEGFVIIVVAGIVIAILVAKQTGTSIYETVTSDLDHGDDDDNEDEDGDDQNSYYQGPATVMGIENGQVTLALGLEIFIVNEDDIYEDECPNRFVQPGYYRDADRDWIQLFTQLLPE